MMLIAVNLYLLFLLGVCEGTKFNWTLELSGITTEEPEVQLCIVKEVPYDEAYLIGVKHNLPPNNNAHHTSVFGFEYAPDAEHLDEIMVCSGKSSRYDTAPGQNGMISGAEIVYGTLTGADPQMTYIFPMGIGKKIGKDSKMKYIKLIMHFPKPIEEPIDTGHTLLLTDVPTNRLAYTHEFIGPEGLIPSMKTVNYDFFCEWPHEQPAYVLKYLVHTHFLGKVVSGYQVRNNEVWTLIGKYDPSVQQSVRDPDTPNIVIQNGDKVAIRCTYENPRSYATKMGQTSMEEMCRYFLIYFIEGEEASEELEWNCSYDVEGWKGVFDNVPEIEANTFNGNYFEPDAGFEYQ